MQKVNNYCRQCGHFVQYYEDSLFNYWVRPLGFCKIKNLIINAKSTCVNFCKQSNTPLTAEEIDCAILAVKQIKKLLKAMKVF